MTDHIDIIARALPDDANEAHDALAALAQSMTEDLRLQIKAALEGNSTDDEHDALVAVADEFGIEYTQFDEENR